jgi:hypothetical protein
MLLAVHLLLACRPAALNPCLLLLHPPLLLLQLHTSALL